jgi:hypothetical protein
MQCWTEFVRDEDEREEVRLAISAILTGWETVIFQVVEEPGLESDSATAAFAP